jgi:hypothetical protein
MLHGSQSQVDWLARYAGNHHQWQDHGDHYVRPLGVVEAAFDMDAITNEGRADTTSLMTLEAVNLPEEDVFRQRILLAWSCLRAHHGLLRAKAFDGSDLSVKVNGPSSERYFMVSKPRDVCTLYDEAQQHATFVQDHYPNVDTRDFYRHTMNTARSINPAHSLSKLYIMPSARLPNGHYRLDFVFVVAHEITDGLSMHYQYSHFLRLLNSTPDDLRRDLHRCTTDPTAPRLPPTAQEDLYPPLSGSEARQRWAWAISRILRHVRRPPPPSFSNPLRRKDPLKTPQAMPTTYAAVLDYSKTPPLSSFVSHVKLSTGASDRVIKLCREVKVTIGVGCFVLVALSMMRMRERHYPADTKTLGLPFTAGFPISPRNLFKDPSSAPTDSLMLAFSDGVTLPYLPSSLPLSGRFRVLARQAQRQLAVLQKRPRNVTPTGDPVLGSRCTAEILPGNYLSMVERTESMLPTARRRVDNDGEELTGLQGAYAAKKGGPATCGISSIGDRRRYFTQGMYDLASSDAVVFMADFRELRAAVRVRDGEFLCASSGDDAGLHFVTSIDGNAIDEDKVKVWEEEMSNMFEVVQDMPHITTQHSKL